MDKAAMYNKRNGFSLIEVLMTCVLLTGGLVVVAAVLEGLALADNATSARVQAKTHASSVLAELKGLHIRDVLRYPCAPDDTQVELLNIADAPVVLPARHLNMRALPPLIEVRVIANRKTLRGHGVAAEAVGFITNRGPKP